jgi:four helix bundle protein
MRTHHDLDVWKNSIQFVSLIYKSTESFPNSEVYGITNQIRRSAVSIPSNISEGAARTSLKEFSHFLSITLGSIAELETQLIISKNLDYLNESQFEKLISDLVSIRRMTLGLKKSINKV